MKFAMDLAVRNLRRRPGRTAALVLLAAFLACSVVGGSVVVMSLRRGLASYEARLGADIVAVPYEAGTKGTLDDILLQGIPGYFYMDNSYYEKIAATEGVETASPQFFLASASAGCCSVAVQIIGFDPETDFIIQPWVRERYSGAIGDGDIIVGADIELPLSGYLTFYNTQCRVAAQLEKTGTGLDTAVYGNMNTIRAMIENAKALGFHSFDRISDGKMVSVVMVKVADGYSIEEVTGDINIHVRHVVATGSKQMVSSIAGGLSGVGRLIGVVIGAVWLLAVGVMLAAFAMIAGERKKEFAVLRTLGASQKMIARLLLAESAAISLLGGVLGAALGALVTLSFHGLIREQLALPYLSPGAGTVLLLAAGAVLLAALSGALAAGFSARRIGKSETGLLLREDG